MQTTRTPYSVSFMATVLLLFLFACHSTIANAAVALGATRVIYPANQKQVLLPVTNNDPASVYLIQSWIENAGDQKDTQFVITPPLFSMQGKKENTLRIINATNHQLPEDFLVPFLSISRRPIRRLQMTPVTADNRLNPSTANPSTRREPISRSQDIAILRKVFITYPTVHTVE